MSVSCASGHVMLPQMNRTATVYLMNCPLLRQAVADSASCLLDGEEKDRKYVEKIWKMSKAEQKTGVIAGFRCNHHTPERETQG